MYGALRAVKCNKQHSEGCRRAFCNYAQHEILQLLARDITCCEKIASKEYCMHLKLFYQKNSFSECEREGRQEINALGYFVHFTVYPIYCKIRIKLNVSD